MCVGGGGVVGIEGERIYNHSTQLVGCWSWEAGRRWDDETSTYHFTRIVCGVILCKGPGQLRRRRDEWRFGPFANTFQGSIRVGGTGMSWQLRFPRSPIHRHLFISAVRLFVEPTNLSVCVPPYVHLVRLLLRASVFTPCLVDKLVAVRQKFKAFARFPEGAPRTNGRGGNQKLHWALP